MKRISVFIIALCITASFYSCGNKKSNDTNSEAAAETTFVSTTPHVTTSALITSTSPAVTSVTSVSSQAYTIINVSDNADEKNTYGGNKSSGGNRGGSSGNKSGSASNNPSGTNKAADPVVTETNVVTTVTSGVTKSQIEEGRPANPSENISAAVIPLMKVSNATETVIADNMNEYIEIYNIDCSDITRNGDLYQGNLKFISHVKQKYYDEYYDLQSQRYTFAFYNSKNELIGEHLDAQKMLTYYEHAELNDSKVSFRSDDPDLAYAKLVKAVIQRPYGQAHEREYSEELRVDVDNQFIRLVEVDTSDLSFEGDKVRGSIKYKLHINDAYIQNCSDYKNFSAIICFYNDDGQLISKIQNFNKMDRDTEYDYNSTCFVSVKSKTPVSKVAVEGFVLEKY